MKFRAHPGETTMIEIRPSVAILGAGMAGVTAARALAERGYPVSLFEKNGCVGGRMASRREGECLFDHGCQFFTVRNERFRNRVESWREQGLVSVWEHRMAASDRGQITLLQDDAVRYVGVPGMDAMLRGIANEVHTQLDTLITRVERTPDGGWTLVSAQGPLPDEYEIVIVATSAEQAAPLLASSPLLSGRAASVRMQACWAALVAFEFELETAFDAAFVRNSPLVWIANGGSKPGRAEREAWVLHASPIWSREHLEEDPDRVKELLLHSFCEAVGIGDVRPARLLAHRWRSAAPANALGTGFLWDDELALGAIGDWCSNPRVENAFLSGLAIADHLLAQRPRAAL
ncbi:MAG: NAD(P)-binding protein [Kiritimatiellae bacterium]|nr:NAD(P)-binding protein [Kiritimatiellia bacterium]